ncbi:MAG: sialidase family protein, partial [Acidobacteria bacterium]|nr:sialidase family protein [Acidobacteriota bacterium]
VVEGELPTTRPLPEAGPKPFQLHVSQRPASASTMDPEKPYFRGPRRFVRIPANSHGPLYSHHNHDVGVAECPNGDLLGIWYTCVQERGRELAVAITRLRRGAEEWDEASPFWDAPDRNDHAPAMWFDGKDTIYHFNGVGVGGRWAPLAGVVRTSKDNGVTWSRAHFVSPEFDFRSMFAQSVVRLADGAIAVAADLSRRFGARDHVLTGLWFSRDEGARRPWDVRAIEGRAADGAGTWRGCGRLDAAQLFERHGADVADLGEHFSTHRWRTEGGAVAVEGRRDRTSLLRTGRAQVRATAGRRGHPLEHQHLRRGLL